MTDTPPAPPRAQGKFKAAGQIARKYPNRTIYGGIALGAQGGPLGLQERHAFEEPGEVAAHPPGGSRGADGGARGPAPGPALTAGRSRISVSAHSSFYLFLSGWGHGLPRAPRTDAAGLAVEDIIVRFAGRQIANSGDLLQELNTHQAGDTVAIQFFRGVRLLEARVALAERT